MSDETLTAATDEAQLTELLSLLLGQDPLLEFDESDKGTKRQMRLREIKDDILRKLVAGAEFTPSDELKLLGLFNLFLFEYGGSITFPYEDVFEWIEFKKQFYSVIDLFDNEFVFKKRRGRPTQGQNMAFKLFSMLCRNHNNPECPHRDKCNCNYDSFLTDVVKIRLANSKQWRERKTKVEKEKIFNREFKAATTAANRIWQQLYDEKPPKMNSRLRESVQEFVLRKLKTS